MPLSYSIDDGSRLVTTVATGVISLADITDYLETMRADPGFDPAFSRLIDALRLERVTFGAEDLFDVARAFSNGISGERARAAIVVADGTLFDYARGFEMITTRMGQDVAVFRDLEHARAWLDAAGD